MPGRLSHAEAESSRKRPRFVGADDDAERVLEVREAHSDLRAGNRKRARISDAGPSKPTRRLRESTHESNDGDRSDDGANSGPVEEGEGSSPPPMTQFDELRDGNFEHLQHEAEDDQRATQRLRFRPNLLGDNAVADNAILESIECINFMCHTRLHCRLGPLLNFIVGENGSGKSAILTAITLCLGGKASSTNRGGSLKSFVKEGCDRAVLIVKIKNQGHDAFKHEVYGDSIIVERHFSKTGSSGFKVKSTTGTTMSTKKQEIEEIVEYYALQVDNPLNVLSQDNARQFLNASTKSQKYQFFVDGVQLQQLDNDYRLINENLENMVAKEPDQEARVKAAEAKLVEAKRKLEALRGNTAIRVKLRDVRNQMVWMQVVYQERELAMREAALAEAIARIAEAERSVEEKTQSLRAADDKIERLEQLIEETKADSVTAEQSEIEAKETHKSVVEELQRLLVQEREAHQNLVNASENLKNTEKKIKEEQQRLEDANGNAHSTKLQELEDAKEKVRTLAAELGKTRDREPELVHAMKEASAKESTVDQELGRKRAELDQIRKRIQELEQNAGSLYDGYEAQLPNLLRAIQHEDGFQNKPIGPLGAHVQLLKPQWSAILEATLGKNLNGFLVTSQHDSKLLSNMMKRFNIRDCPVLLSGSRQQLNLQGKEPDESFDTILRVLKFDNNLVRDQLILNHMIEQVVLTEERTKAENIMFSGAPPRNVKAVVCFQNGTRGNGLRLTDNNGVIGTSPIRAMPHQRARMKGDSGSQIVFLKDQFQQLEIERKTIEGEKRRAQQEAQRCRNDIEKCKKDRKILDTQHRKAQLDVDKIEGELDKFEGADGRLQGLMGQLDDIKSDRDHHGTQYGLLRNKKEERNKISEDLRRRHTELKTAHRDCVARLEKVEGKLKRVQDTRKITLTELNEAVASVDLFNEEKVTMEGKVERQKAAVAHLTDQAKEAAPTRVEIPENETAESLQKKYDTLEARIVAAEKKAGFSEKEITDLIIKETHTRDKDLAIYRSILQVNQGLKQTLSIRLEKWRMFQRHITAQSRCNFQYLLAERGFRGKLLFDHRRKFLDLQVEPDKTEKRASGRSTKTLSGGEKSFSSICLLLSIWEAMGSPLRCLDEFDVFMDNVNRAISTNMLITAARRSVNRQYIFITPNAIEGRNTLDKDVKIIRLTDPRQRTLVDH